MSIEIAGITFDHVRYDADGDVLYLHHGGPSTAVDFDADGTLVGITILNARWLLERDNAITLTIEPPAQERLGDAELHDVLLAA